MRLFTDRVPLRLKIRARLLVMPPEPRLPLLEPSPTCKVPLILTPPVKSLLPALATINEPVPARFSCPLPVSLPVPARVYPTELLLKVMAEGRLVPTSVMKLVPGWSSKSTASKLVKTDGLIPVVVLVQLGEILTSQSVKWPAANPRQRRIEGAPSTCTLISP